MPEYVRLLRLLRLEEHNASLEFYFFENYSIWLTSQNLSQADIVQSVERSPPAR